MNERSSTLDIYPRILARLNCPLEEIEKLCRKFHVIELSVFRSVVRDDFKQSSDIDFLVDFDPEAHATYHEFYDLGEALNQLTGRTTDVVPKNGLKELVCKEVFSESKVICTQPSSTKMIAFSSFASEFPA